VYYKCKHRCRPHNLFIGSKVKTHYMFQPPRWSSSGVITNVIGRTFCHWDLTWHYMSEYVLCIQLNWYTNIKFKFLKYRFANYTKEYIYIFTFVINNSVFYKFKFYIFVPIKLYTQQLLWHVMPSDISVAKGSSYYICNNARWWPPAWLKHVANFNFWTNKQVVRTASNCLYI
jgi:hypothetical protein